MPPALWRRSAFVAAFLVAFVLAAPASGQYFGQNKVQYRTLNFQVLTTEHFDIYFYESERNGVDIAARLAERWHARLERLFGHRLSGRQPLVLYASHSDFEQTNVIGGTLTEGTGGVTEPSSASNRVAAGGPDRRHGSRHRPRTRPRVSIRPHIEVRDGPRREPRADSAALVH